MPWLRFELWSFLCLPYERFSQMSYLQVYKSVTDVERVISFLFKLFVFSKFFIFSLIGKFVGKLVELFFSVFALQTCCFLVWVPFFSPRVCVSQSILSRLTTLWRHLIRDFVSDLKPKVVTSGKTEVKWWSWAVVNYQNM